VITILIQRLAGGNDSARR